MKTNYFVAPVLTLATGLATFAQSAPPAKVGIIHIQNAILSTKDGQKAGQELQQRFASKKTELEKKQNDIQNLQQQLSKGSATLSDDAKQKLMRDIDQKNKALTRDTEDAQAEVNQEEGKLMNDLGGRLMQVIDKYARDNAYTLILDVSSPQTPVLYAANGIDITTEIVALYDKNAPSSVAPSNAPAAAPKPTPAAPVRPPLAPPAAPTQKKK